MHLSNKTITQMKLTDIQFHEGLRKKDINHAKAQRQEKAKKRTHQLNSRELCKMDLHELYESDFYIS